MFLFKDKSAIQPLSLKDVLMALGPNATQIPQKQQIQTPSITKAQLMQRYGIAGYISSLEKQAEFLSADLNWFKKQYQNQFDKWKQEIAKREVSLPFFCKSVEQIKKKAEPKLKSQLQKIYQLRCYSDRLLSSVQDLRQSLNLINHYGNGKSSKIIKLIRSKRNIQATREILVKLVSDKQLFKLLYQSVDTDINKFHIIWHKLEDAIAILKNGNTINNQDRQHVIKTMLIRFLQNQQVKIKSHVISRLKQSFKSMPKDYSAIIMVFYQLKQNIVDKSNPFSNLQDVIQELLTTVEQQCEMVKKQDDLKQNNKSLSFISDLIIGYSKIIQNWQLINRWHLAYKGGENQEFDKFVQLIGKDLMQNRKPLWKRIQDRILSLLKNDKNVVQQLSDMIYMINGVYSLVHKGKTFAKNAGSSNSLQKHLKQIYDRYLNCALQKEINNFRKWKSCTLSGYLKSPQTRVKGLKRMLAYLKGQSQFFDEQEQQNLGEKGISSTSRLPNRRTSLINSPINSQQKISSQKSIKYKKQHLQQLIYLNTKGESSWLFHSLAAHLLLTNVYPHAIRRIMKNWMMFASAAIKKALENQIQPQLMLSLGFALDSISEIRKLNAKTPQKMADCLEAAREHLIYRQKYPKLIGSITSKGNQFILKSVFEGDAVHLFESIEQNLDFVGQQINFVASAELQAENQQLKPLLDNQFAQIRAITKQAKSIVLNDNQIKLQIKNWFTKNGITGLVNLKKSIQYQLGESEIAKRYFLWQIYSVITKEQKGNDSLRSNLKKQIGLLVNKIGVQQGTHFLKLMDLYQQKDLASVVKQIQGIKLNLPLKCYLSVFTIGAGVDRQFASSKKEMQARVCQAFARFIDEQIKKTTA